jgi:uncharacterized membrane protein YoaT (DUF817 family)
MHNIIQSVWVICRLRRRFWRKFIGLINSWRPELAGQSFLIFPHCNWWKNYCWDLRVVWLNNYNSTYKSSSVHFNSYNYCRSHSFCHCFVLVMFECYLLSNMCITCSLPVLLKQLIRAPDMHAWKPPSLSPSLSLSP